MTSKVSPNKNTALAMDQKIVQGVATYFAKVKNMNLAGTSLTPAALKAVFQAEIDACNALDKAKAQMKEQVAATRVTRAKASVTRKSLRAYVLGNFGAEAVEVLESFGMTPPKPPGPKTVEAKAQAAAKAAATKKANGKGKTNQPAPVAPSTAAQASPPAHVAQTNGSTPAAAPAAITTPQQQ